jgi:hypothetical protein
MSAEPKLTAYLAVLEARGWVWVPMARDTGISYVAHIFSTAYRSSGAAGRIAALTGRPG